MNENQNIEWKAVWRDDYLEWVCCFANAQGGVLEIGRDDKGNVVGVDRAKKLLEDLPNKMRDTLGIVPEVDLITEEGKALIRITIDAYPHPVSYKGQYHYRSGSTKQVLKGAELDRFLLGKMGKHWDSVPMPRVSIADLDADAIERFRQWSVRSKRLTPEMVQVDDATLIEKLRLTEGDYLKRAAVLLFHSDPERFITGAFIKVAYFKTNSYFQYQDEVHGDLFTQVAQIMELLLTKYLIALVSYEGLFRLETYPVPESALREAILNAVVHKDYGSGVPIQIRVYDDKILIWNNGRLPENWTVEKLLSPHHSRPFNPDIANVFFRTGMIEAWGRGIEQMQADCKAHGVPGPLLKPEADGLWLEFKNHGDLNGSGIISSPTSVKTSAKTSVKTLGKTAVKILELIRPNPHITISQMAEDVGKSQRAIEMQIAILKENGYLQRIGPPRGGYWRILENRQE